MIRTSFLLCFLFFFLVLCESPAAEKELQIQQILVGRNSEYIISDNYNLQGTTIEIPENFKLTFRGGSICNGNIIFNSTKLINPKFVSCKFSGNIISEKVICDSCFSRGSVDDNNVLKWLIEQAANNKSSLELSRNYFINTHGQVMYGTWCYVNLYKTSLTINGNYHTIYDTYPHRKGVSTSFILGKECKNIQIKNLCFECKNNKENNITENDSFPSPGGTHVIRLIGDSDNISIIGGKCRYCMSYLYCGMDPHGEKEVEENYVVKGFTNICAQVNAFDTSYPVAIYKGNNIRIDLDFLYAHRGCRLQGVKNAKVRISGAFVSTPVMLLLKDAISYSDHKYTTRVYNECSKIDATIERLDIADSLTKHRWYDIAANIGCYNTKDPLKTATQFAKRQKPYRFRNIVLSYKCNVQKYAVGFSGYSKDGLTDVYDIKLSNCQGGGILGDVDNEFRLIKLSIMGCRLDRLYLSFNESDKIKIVNSTIGQLRNKKRTSPQIKIIKSEILSK